MKCKRCGHHVAWHNELLCNMYVVDGDSGQLERCDCKGYQSEAEPAEKADGES